MMITENQSIANYDNTFTGYNSSIRDKGAIAFSNAIRVNKCLNVLDLYDNEGTID